VFIPCWPWGAYLGEGALEKGVDACISSWHRMAPNTTPSGAKIAGNYLGGQLIKMEALANGYDEAIALGPDGLISEGSGQNVFIVQKGVVFTTPMNGTLLPGITRDTVMTLARDAGLDVREAPLQRELLYTCDELFLTGTASEVTPVRSVDKIKVGAGKTGEVTRLLQRTYLDLVQGKIEDKHNWLCHVNAERAAVK
jgi:branched-chain amino acid aminotransferase